MLWRQTCVQKLLPDYGYQKYSGDTELKRISWLLNNKSEKSAASGRVLALQAGRENLKFFPTSE